MQTHAAAQETKQHRSIWDGVYTAAQADRGKAAYSKRCIHCHGADLTGYGNVLTGQKFLDNWREDNLEKFFLAMRSTMPRTAPGGLSNQEYLDIVAYILAANNFPRGDRELALGSLKDIQVELESGPAPLPGGSLVVVVGCLVQDADRGWKLTKATEPVRTRKPDASSPEELKAWESKPFGTRNFLLMDSQDYHADSKKNHKVEAKGLLILDPAGDRLNLSSLQMTAVECGK